MLFALVLAACASADTKVGPEEGSASSESTISNYYTTIVGTLTLGETANDSIRYPDYYLGRTVRLHKGQSLKLVVSGSHKSTVQFYGPATSFTANGDPRFGQAMVSAATKKSGSKQTVTLGVTAPADGMYMLVYGPDNVWNASFQVTATCTANCELISAEGESCGGHVPVELFRKCESPFECVAPHGIIADIPGHCGVYATVAELTANPAAYEGHFVAVRGDILRRVAACTKIACSTSNPCCNQCSAALNLFDTGSDPTQSVGVYLTENGAGFSCSGNSCDYQNHCALETGDYYVAGWFTLDGGVTPTIDVVRKFAAF